MLLHNDVVTDGEPKPGSFSGGFRCEERVEHLFFYFWWKAANQANKITEKAYVAKCRAEGAAAQPTPAAAAAPTAATAKSAAGKPKDGRQAEYARERACGQDWKADKLAGKIPAGMKWPQYCNKRKKAAEECERVCSKRCENRL